MGTMVSATTDMAMEAMPTPASTAATMSTASAPLTPRLTPIPTSSTTVSATWSMAASTATAMVSATLTPPPTATTATTASAPLTPMPSPTTPTATPAPTAMPAGDTAASTATTDKQRRRTSFAQPDEGTQQYSVFKCDEQTATSQRKYRRALRRSTKLPVAAVMSVIKKQNTE